MEYLFTKPGQLDETIAALYAASDVIVNYDRDFADPGAVSMHGVDVLNRALNFEPLELLIDEDGNLVEGLVIVLPTAFIAVVSDYEGTLYWAVIDFNGVAGVIELSEDPRDIPTLIRYMLSSPTRYANTDEAFEAI